MHLVTFLQHHYSQAVLRPEQMKRQTDPVILTWCHTSHKDSDIGKVQCMYVASSYFSTDRNYSRIQACSILLQPIRELQHEQTKLFGKCTTVVQTQKKVLTAVEELKALVVQQTRKISQRGCMHLRWSNKWKWIKIYKTIQVTLQTKAILPLRKELAKCTAKIWHGTLALRTSMWVVHCLSRLE